ncbi:MAG: glycine oxidase ThiO [Planctomycetaceae bacterium]
MRIDSHFSIVGAGVIGLSIAWELSRRGAQVRVFERSQAAREASWAASGILPAANREFAPDPLERLRGLSHELYPRWSDRLAETTGIDVELRRCGGLYLASSAGEAASLLAGLDYQRDLQIEMHSLTREQLAADEPALARWGESDRFRAAVLSPDEWKIRPPALLAALLAACAANGVRIEEHTPAQLRIDSKQATLQVESVDDTHQHRPSDQVILCGGAWTGQIANSLGLGQSLIPIRGQILMYRFDSPPLKRIVNEGHRYLVPRDDGRLIVGSCEEEVGFAKGTTAAMLESITQWAESILPCLSSMKPERSWSGLRPATFDGFPIIGKVPDVANLFIASGHYRSGIHLAPATAVVLADILEGRPAEVDIDPFRVARLMTHS